MVWIAIAGATSQLSAPEPKEVWFEPIDFWPQVLAQQSLSSVRLRITVGPDSRVQTCEIEQSSGNSAFDVQVCEITMKRARFRAATLQNGTPAYGAYRVPLVWTAFPPSWYHRRPPGVQPKGDLNLTVASLPKAKRLPIKIDIALAVEADGRVVGCETDDRKQDPTLVGLACQEMASEYRPIPARRTDGSAVLS